MRRSWLAFGGLAAALGASSCRVLPLVFFTFGISGAWIGNFTALAPYQPFFVGAALVLIALGLVRDCWRTLLVRYDPHGAGSSRRRDPQYSMGHQDGRGWRHPHRGFQNAVVLRTAAAAGVDAMRSSAFAYRTT